MLHCSVTHYFWQARFLPRVGFVNTVTMSGQRTVFPERTETEVKPYGLAGDGVCLDPGSMDAISANFGDQSIFPGNQT